MQGFEDSLLMKMKEGWDGSEEENNIQWTFAGALFYSIIVITTIGESIFKAEIMEETGARWHKKQVAPLRLFMTYL